MNNKKDEIPGFTERNDITEEDIKKAEECLECLLCSRARKKQKGITYWFVKNVEVKICPYCKAYEKVYVRKAYEPIPDE